MCFDIEPVWETCVCFDVRPVWGTSVVIICRGQGHSPKRILGELTFWGFCIELSSYFSMVLGFYNSEVILWGMNP